MNKKIFPLFDIPVEIKLLDELLLEIYNSNNLVIPYEELKNKFITTSNNKVFQEKNSSISNSKGNYEKDFLSAINFLESKKDIIYKEHNVIICFQGVHKILNGGYSKEFRTLKLNSILTKFFWLIAVVALIFFLYNTIKG